MLKRITIENFMSHAQTVIDLADGLTVLTGPNNCGKSAVVAALQILAANGKTTHVMRHDAKQCRVTVETDDGHTIRWQRKGNSVSYTLNGEDIHRIGQSTPDLLHDLLRLEQVEGETGGSKDKFDVHFGEQKSPIFLLDKTGSRAAAFFASSSDASRLVEMQHLHRTRLRERKKEAKRLTVERQKVADRLNLLEPLDEIAERAAQAEALQNSIQTNAEQTARLTKIANDLRRQRQQCERLNRLSDVLDRLKPAAATSAELERSELKQSRLRKVVRDLRDLHVRLRDYRNHAAALDPLQPTPTLDDVDGLRTRIAQLRSTTGRMQAARAALDCCAAIVPPPQQQPVVTGRRLLHSLIAANNARHNADRICRSLAALTPTPLLENPQSLRSTISKLAAANRRQQDLRSVQRELEQLYPAPELRDPGSVAATVEKLTRSIATVAAARRAVHNANRELETCDAEIRAYVKANPTCETCGAEIDPDALLSTTHSMHTHCTTAG